MGKKKLKIYRKSVSIVDESAVDIYENLGAEKIGFLMESTDKENDSYTFMGVEPDALIQSKGNSLVIKYSDGRVDVMEGNPLDSLKEFYSSFDVSKEECELEFNGGLVGSLGYDFIRYTEKPLLLLSFVINPNNKLTMLFACLHTSLFSYNFSSIIFLISFFNSGYFSVIFFLPHLFLFDLISNLSLTLI